jgi:type VI secretion system VasD/TssJ family lipoprotein
VEDAVTKLQDAIKKAEEAATRAEEAAKKTAESYGKVKESLVEVDKTPVDIRKVNFRIKADPKLNFYEGASHTLLLCMYQLTDENAFLQIAEAREGTQKLLECKKFDPSVTSYRNVLLQPGQEYNETRDLSDNVKYIGIVAGYYQNTDKAGHHRLFKAPAKGVKVDLYMGPLEIQ